MVLLFAKNWPKIMYFWIRRNPAINKRKAHKPSLYSDVVRLSLYAQCKFHMDLNLPSIKLSGMKFLPRSFETKTGSVAAITPSFSFFNKLFRLLHYVVASYNGISSKQKCIGPTSAIIMGLFV